MLTRELTYRPLAFRRYVCDRVYVLSPESELFSTTRGGCFHFVLFVLTG